MDEEIYLARLGMTTRTYQLTGKQIDIVTADYLISKMEKYIYKDKQDDFIIDYVNNL